MSQNFYIATTRFGLGFGPQETRLTDADVMKWLWSQVQKPEAASRDFAALPSTAQYISVVQQDRLKKNQEGKRDMHQALRSAYQNELQARITHAVTTPTPFYERLVNFWSNHFTVSIQKGAVRGIAGSYEREAIRPNVTGKFEDMLLAVVRHPAMLNYLDNAQSIGAESMAGMRRNKGLNENLAREIMELHTLGVNGGYSQTDVTTFAKVITGWGIAGPKETNPGTFLFAPNRHEPGAQTVLGKTYPAAGEQQGVAVLRDLAKHPATAQHLAFKLARHFIADVPPDSAVKQIAAAFSQSGGDLKTVYRTLLGLPEAWSVATPKIKDSYDLIVSAARFCADGAALDVPWCLQSLNFLGGMPFDASSPAGLPDTARDIAGPEAILRRIEWAQGAGAKLAGSQSYAVRAEAAFGAIMSAKTRESIARAGDTREQLALIFGSPEFQRR